MDNPLYAVTAAIAVLTVFLVVSNALRYAGISNFVRARLSMTLFFWFIVATLTIAFGDYAVATMPYTIPAFCIGIIVGYVFGVKAAEQKLRMQGLERYMEHFTHIHIADFKKFTWWTFINFYSVMGALLLVNLVGLSRVLFNTAPDTVVRTSAVGAFLLGTIFPYLAHLWSIKAPHHNSSTTSDAKNT